LWPKANGLLGLTPFVDLKSELFLEFEEQWKTLQPGHYANLSYSQVPQGLSLFDYDAVYIIAQALQVAIENEITSPDELLKILRSQKRMGITGYVSMTTDGERIGSYSILNFQVNSSQIVGKGNDTSIELQWEAITWPGGYPGREIPPDSDLPIHQKIQAKVNSLLNIRAIFICTLMFVIILALFLGGVFQLRFSQTNKPLKRLSTHITKPFPLLQIGSLFLFCFNLILSTGILIFVLTDKHYIEIQLIIPFIINIIFDPISFLLYQGMKKAKW
jgi:hypothetical protein